MRAAIDASRQRAGDRLAALQRQFADILSASAEAVRDDEHDPEGVTIAFERAQVASLRSQAQAQLAALDAAAAHLESRDGGRCVRCGAPIGYERLLARPASIRCVVCAALS